jgi:hypothetical protein
MADPFAASGWAVCRTRTPRSAAAFPPEHADAAEQFLRPTTACLSPRRDRLPLCPKHIPRGRNLFVLFTLAGMRGQDVPSLVSGCRSPAQSGRLPHPRAGALFPSAAALAIAASGPGFLLR